jgi:hypothetical protein
MEYTSIARALVWLFATYDLDDFGERDGAASLANIIYFFNFLLSDAFAVLENELL